MKKFINEKMKKRKGFTLVELVVVIAILGILAAVAVPRFTGIRHEATVKSEGSTAASIISAARVQEAETGDAVTGAVNGTSNAAGLKEKYMVVPAAATGKYPTFTLAKTAETYSVTWTSEAGGNYNNVAQTLNEGSAFTPIEKTK